jgi:AcrR family transcriptional regulator
MPTHRSACQPPAGQALAVTVDKPLRADARRNRARVLAAADTVFATKGISASTDEVAREAGVGIGTLFRHFPTKEALLEAVLIARIQTLINEATALCTATDPGAAFFDFLTRIINQSPAKNLLVDALAAAGVDVDSTIAHVGQELLQIVNTLLVRAQQAGAVRTDVQTADLIPIIIGASRAIEHAAADDTLQPRVLRLILDGLRAKR